ncbi:MAG: DUF3883 domain-containing protein [Pyrobaculum sp.]
MREALQLAKAVLEGFKYHPYIFVLRQASAGDSIYPYAHQLELLANVMPRHPIRVLIADEIGLGKTVEAILLIKYLREVGLAKRVLVLVPRVLVEQWVGELKRFGFAVTDIRRIERNTIGDLKTFGFPNGVYVASIDLVKRREHKGVITEVEWDVIIVDEAHRVGKVGGKETQRFELVSALAGRTPHVILLTATPHRGKADDYIERVKLLDPFLNAGAKELDVPDFYKLINGVLIFRRTKLDVNEIYERRTVFTKAKFKARTVDTSEEEREFHDKLVELLRKILLDYYAKKGEEPKALSLLLVLIAKRASSSPRAALVTLDRIIGRRSAELKHLAEGEVVDVKALEKEAEEIVDEILGYGGYEDAGEALEERKAEEVDDIVNSFAEKCSYILEPKDIEILKELHRLAGTIVGEGDSRLKAVVNLVQRHLQQGDKVVIFTEFRDTAEYVYKELKNRLPERWRGRIVLITSGGIIPPDSVASARGRKYGIEDVKRWLSEGRIDVVVSTDVASEGLNLQAANVIIHYEPPWSPIKIVQRIGRVWRLGQNRDVTSYTLLLMVESDLRALEVLYAKLLAWYISGIEKTVPIGEELEIDLLSRQSTGGSDLAVLVPLQDEKGRAVQFSEYKAWLEFIRGGGKALEEYINTILNMLKKLKALAERVKAESGDRAVKVGELMENLLSGLYGEKAETALVNFAMSLARVKGMEVKVAEKRMLLGPYAVDLRSPSDLYKALGDMLRETSGGGPPIVIAKLDRADLRELFLYKVEAYLGKRPFYSEVIGVARDNSGSTKIIAGAELISVLSKAFEGAIGVVHETSGLDPGKYADLAKSKAEGKILRLLSPFSSYLEKTEKLFKAKHVDWAPRSPKNTSVSSQLIGAILFHGGGIPSRVLPPPPIAIEEVEKKAMELVMEYERRAGRMPEDVSRYEHYDIRSIDPKTGEVRYIEVKGRAGPDLGIELTEAEFEVAKTLREKYWLYIVYNIGQSPQILAIRNPAENVRWREVGSKRYRLEV